MSSNRKIKLPHTLGGDQTIDEVERCPNASLVPMTSDAEVLASYRSRVLTFEFDSEQQELGQKNDSEQDYNRPKIAQRDLGDLSTIATLTSVQWGTWGGDSACLMCVRVQFQKGLHKLLRFGQALIVIQYSCRPPGATANDPRVVDYGPKSLRAKPTEEDRTWWYDINFSAKAPAGPVSLGPGVNGGKNGKFARKYAAEVTIDDWSPRTHRFPNCVKCYLKEDPKQADGVPCELNMAVIIQASGPCQATVVVRAGNIFNLLATPWTRDDPVLLKPGVNYGTQVCGATAMDFQSLTKEDWKNLVTPDLEFSYVTLI